MAGPQVPPLDLLPLVPSPSIGMASSHSHHRLPWKRGELVFCLKSETSVGADVGRPHMLVEVTLSFFMKFAIPSPVEGGFYRFGCYINPRERYRLPVDNPSLCFSTPDASAKTAAMLVPDAKPRLGEILRLLVPDISRFAHATMKSAESQGHTAMKVSVEAVAIVMVNFDMVEKYWRLRLADDVEEEESLGTCAVCLGEIRKERFWPARLACSHTFHLRCIALWLQRQNSCPLCRSKQHIIVDA